MLENKIVERIIQCVFADHYEESRGGLDNPRNRWIIRLVMVCKDWFRMVSLHFRRVTLHNQSSVRTLKTVLSVLDNKPLSEFNIVKSLEEIRFESMDRVLSKDREQYLFFIMNRFHQHHSLTSMLFIDSDIALSKIGSQTLSSCEYLRSLVVSSSAVASTNLKTLAGLIEGSKGLKSIYLYCESGYSGLIDLLSSISFHPQLHDLQLNFNELQSESTSNQIINSICANQHRVKAPSRIQLSGLDIQSSNAGQLLSSLESLEALNLPFKFHDSTLFTQSLSAHKALKELFLYADMEDPVDEKQQNHWNQSFKSLVLPPTLELLSIEQQPKLLSSEFLKNLVNLPALSVLKLSMKTLSNQLMEALAEVANRSESLYFLSICDNQLSQEKEISDALSNPKSTIRELDLSGNQFKGSHLLAALSKNDKVLSLTLNSDSFTSEVNQSLQSYTNDKNKSLISFLNTKSNRIHY